MLTYPKNSCFKAYTTSNIAHRYKRWSHNQKSIRESTNDERNVEEIDIERKKPVSENKFSLLRYYSNVKQSSGGLGRGRTQSPTAPTGVCVAGKLYLEKSDDDVFQDGDGELF